ncbi:hypothetical protein AAC387_Pa04g1427 [Persea americana]
MALKAFAFLLASFLLVTSKVLSSDEDTYAQMTYASVPAAAPPHAPVHAPPPIPYMAPVSKSDCPKLCKERCKLHSRPNHCNTVCCTCCVRCKCVPPGTAGKRELCGKCYTDMTTHGNRTKCP